MLLLLLLQMLLLVTFTQSYHHSQVGSRSYAGLGYLFRSGTTGGSSRSKFSSRSSSSGSSSSRSRSSRIYSSNENKENDKLAPATDINKFENFLLQDGQGAEGGDMSLDEGMRVKLKSEVVSPFRRFRQFILFGVLASAGLGTFTAVPQLLITLNNPENPKIPLETAYQNVAVDVLGLLGSAYFLFKDFTSKSDQSSI